jgi:hypothetical protein
MNTRLDTVGSKFAGSVAARTAPEAAARPSCQAQPSPAEDTAWKQSKVAPGKRKNFRWGIALCGGLVLVVGSLAAQRISLTLFTGRPAVVSYNHCLADLDTKLTRALASHLREAGFDFDAAVVSVEGPACERAVCLVKMLSRGDAMVSRCQIAGHHSGNGSWSFAGTGSLAEIKFDVDAAAEMRRLAENTPPDILQVPVSAAPIPLPGQTASPFDRAFDLCLSGGPDRGIVQWLDLETGRRLAEPDWEYWVSSTSYSQWLRRNSLDLTLVAYGSCYHLLTRRLAVAPVDARLWDQAQPAEIVSHPALQVPPPSLGSFSPVNDRMDTYVFRTEEGTFGILRVITFKCTAQELRIQYKLAPSMRRPNK